MPDVPAGSMSFEPLTPTAFLDRSADVYADRIGVVDGPQRWTYAQLRERCLRQAGVLASLGVLPGDRVAVLAPNSHLMLEAHYAVPYAGAVLVALNVRLAREELRYIVDHADARVVIHAPEYTELAASLAGPGRVIVAADEPYEQRLVDATPLQIPVRDETGLLALNYTSGTTGRPKGVMYHRRGAYLQALAMANQMGMSLASSYLWTLPMFHCNGWCFTWAVTAAGGRHICLPRVDPTAIWQLLTSESITHLCAAPTVLVSLVNDAAAQPLTGPRVSVAVGGAPPAPALLEACSALGMDLTHLYGLTETFGPAVICDWRPEWNGLDVTAQAAIRARQGVANVVSHRVRVVAAEGGDVPRDGTTVGEIALRGNNVMLGYYRDPAATAAVSPDGWFRTGDLAVVHPDGYLEIRDRAKDVIISGGENISSVEVESVLVSHPSVLEAAVIPIPDDRWGERPLAWVTLKAGFPKDEEGLRTYLRSRLASFKVPDRIQFGPLPKTASGKIRKFELRQAEWSGRSRVGGVGGTASTGPAPPSGPALGGPAP